MLSTIPVPALPLSVPHRYIDPSFSKTPLHDPKCCGTVHLSINTPVLFVIFDIFDYQTNHSATATSLTSRLLLKSSRHQNMHLSDTNSPNAHKWPLFHLQIQTEKPPSLFIFVSQTGIKRCEVCCWLRQSDHGQMGWSKAGCLKERSFLW